MENCVIKYNFKYLHSNFCYPSSNYLPNHSIAMSQNLKLADLFLLCKILRDSISFCLRDSNQDKPLTYKSHIAMEASFEQLHFESFSRNIFGRPPVGNWFAIMSSDISLISHYLMSTWHCLHGSSRTNTNDTFIFLGCWRLKFTLL